MKKKWIALILAAAMTAAALPGCSSPAGGSSAPAGDSSGAAKQTVVKVAGYSQYNPYTYLDANGDPAGYDVEVLAAVAEKLPQYKFEWDMIDWDAELVGVQSGKYALCSANIWKTAEREKIYLFEKNPINYSSVSLVVRKDDASINTLDDLVGKKVAPLASSNALISVISDYNKAHPDKQIQVENVNGFGNADGMKAVASGRYDAQVLPDNTFEKVQSQVNLNLRKTDAVAYQPSYYLFNIKQTKLRDDIDKALGELTADGTLSKLSQKWFSKDVFQDAKTAESSESK